MNFPSNKNCIPPTVKHLKEFADHKELIEKYNELLSLDTTQSLYIDPVPNKSGMWQIEWTTYTKKWLDTYGKK